MKRCTAVLPTACLSVLALACEPTPVERLDSPGLEFADTMSSLATIDEVDFGDVTFGRTASRFVFLRSKREALDITKVELVAESGHVSAQIDETLPVRLEPFRGSFGQVAVVEIRIDAVDAAGIAARLVVHARIGSDEAQYVLPIRGSIHGIEVAARPTHATLETVVGRRSVEFVMVTNTAAYPVVIDHLVIDGESFDLGRTAAPEVLDAGATMMVQVGFQSKLDGEQRGALHVVLDDGRRLTVLLTGRAVLPPRALIQLTEVDFGSVERTATARIRVKNVGGSDLHVAEPRILLGDEAGFSVYADDTIVLPGESTSVMVTFDVRFNGIAQGLLLIETDDPATTLIPLRADAGDRR